MVWKSDRRFMLYVILINFTTLCHQPMYFIWGAPQRPMFHIESETKWRRHIEFHFRYSKFIDLDSHFIAIFLYQVVSHYQTLIL